MKIEVQVTHYSIDRERNRLVETTTTEEHEVKIIEGRSGKYLQLGDGPQSMPLERLDEAIEVGWLAQFGTQPVYSPPCEHPDSAPECCGRTCQLPRGGWGGRNYPAMRVDGEELRRVREELVPA